MNSKYIYILYILYCKSLSYTICTLYNAKNNENSICRKIYIYIVDTFIYIGGSPADLSTSYRESISYKYILEGVDCTGYLVGHSSRDWLKKVSRFIMPVSWKFCGKFVESPRVSRDREQEKRETGGLARGGAKPVIPDRSCRNWYIFIE